MAGLDPAIYYGVAAESISADNREMHGGWMYIVTNWPNGTLYVGVTSNLARRVWEHREGAVDGFTERHEDIRAAIQREKNLKHCPRGWKVDLIFAQNPEWLDLYDCLA